MLLSRDPRKAVARVEPTAAYARRRPVTTIVCHDCGCEIRRESTHLACDCGIAFTASWDVSLGHGVFLGRLNRAEEVPS
jgi:hypothetical protein